MCVHKNVFNDLQVVKGIDAVTREQLARLVVILGLDRLNPILGTLAIPGLRRPLSLTPTLTQEDEAVLNNVRRIVGFLSAGTIASRSLSQVCAIKHGLFDCTTSNLMCL